MPKDGNPQSALNAITAQGERVSEFFFSEVTFAKAALLERIGSPFASGGKVEATSVKLFDLLSALFILANPAQKIGDLIRDNAFEGAVEAWGDILNMSEIPAMADALQRIFKRVDDVTPRGAATEKKP